MIVFSYLRISYSEVHFIGFLLATGTSMRLLYLISFIFLQEIIMNRAKLNICIASEFYITMVCYFFNNFTMIRMVSVKAPIRQI